MAQQKTMATCTECGAKVRKDNLRSHMDRVHKKTGAVAAKQAQGGPRPIRPRAKDKKKVSPWPAIGLAALMALSSIGAYAILTQKSGNPSSNPTPSGNRKAVVVTNMGTFTIELYEDKAPLTAGHFIDLAKSGFFNGLVFHRVIANFVVQGGGFYPDRTPKTSANVDWENTGLKNDRATVAMARGGSANDAQAANSATSQFYVNLVNSDANKLDDYTYPYVVFGKVTEGMSVVDAIGQVSVDSDDWPITSVIMSSVTIV